MLANKEQLYQSFWHWAKQQNLKPKKRGRGPLESFRVIITKLLFGGGAGSGEGVAECLPSAKLAQKPSRIGWKFCFYNYKKWSLFIVVWRPPHTKHFFVGKPPIFCRRRKIGCVWQFPMWIGTIFLSWRNIWHARSKNVLSDLVG